MVFFTGLAFTACETMNQDKLIGKWSLQSIDLTEVADGVTTTSHIDQEGSYIEFLSDGMYIATELGEAVSESGKWKLDGDWLVILDQGTEDERSYIIKEVTSSKLDLEYHDSYKSSGVEYDLTYVYHYIKIK